VSPLESEVDRQEHEQGDDQLDPEMVRIPGERVRPVDVGALDRAVHVDLARTPGDRLDERRVEVAPRRLGDAELHGAVEGVEHEPAAERAERQPVEPFAPPHHQRDPRYEEAEVEDELDEALAPLLERL